MNLEQGLSWERNIEQPGPGVAHDKGARAKVSVHSQGAEAEEKIIPRATSTGST